ncbi:MAG: sigma-70 family RNA polymerase sigma factor [Candidatus Lokiarchaeota archaeon]|nr:sigma-70 family RNA polymerase sigma factor [Candidatus Lokiarchaeota archaeon]
MRNLSTNNNAILNRNGIENYLNDIKELQKQGFKPMEKEVEKELIIKAQNGDIIARDTIIKCNLTFVIAVAKQYQNRGLELPDLINEGNIGMAHAIEKFDTNTNFKFITYAVNWIRQSIGHAITNNSKMVDMPLNIWNEVNAIKTAMHKFEQENYYQPSVLELAEMLNMDEEKVDELMQHANNSTMSFDKPMKDEEGSNNLYDIFENSNAEKTDKNINQESMLTEIERAMNVLKEREKTILKMFFGIGYDFEYTLNQIAEELNLTHERVRQLKELGIKKLSATSNAKLMRAYL